MAQKMCRKYLTAWSNSGIVQTTKGSSWRRKACAFRQYDGFSIRKGMKQRDFCHNSGRGLVFLLVTAEASGNPEFTHKEVAT